MKHNIVAKWKTGEYTKVQLAKAYKVDEKTIRKIVGTQQTTNAEIVEAGVLVEKAKMSAKSPLDKKEIDNAIKYRLEHEYNHDNNRIKVYDATSKVLDAVVSLLDKGKAQKILMQRHAESQVAVIVGHNLQAEHLEKAMNTIDKASLTIGVNHRHANAEKYLFNDSSKVEFTEFSPFPKDDKQVKTIKLIREVATSNHDS